MIVVFLPIVALGILFGIFWGTHPGQLSIFTVLLFATAGMMLATVFQGPKVRGIGILLLALIVGAMWGNRVAEHDAQVRSMWKQYEGDIAVLEGKVMFQEERGTSVRIRLGEVMYGRYDLPGRIEFWVPITESTRIGDHVSVRGRIELPEDRVEAGTFRPAEYYARHDVFALLRSPQIRVLEQREERSVLMSIHDFLRSRLVRFVPEPSAGLLAAVLLGDRSGIPSVMREQFAVAGVAHLIAISGLHTGLFAAAAFFLCGMLGLPRIVAAGFSCGSALLFIAIAGFPPSGIRALVMVFVFVLAYTCGRRVHIVRALLIAAAVMAMVEPRIVRSDAGFQLSVAAMWGIAAWYPIFCPLVPHRVILRGVVMTMLITLSATLVTAPAVMYMFGRVSIIGLFVNIIAAPVFPLLMVGGIGIMAVGGVPFLGPAMATIVHAVSSLFVFSVSGATHVPGAALEIPLHSASICIGIYAVLFIIPVLFVPSVRAQLIPDKYEA